MIAVVMLTIMAFMANTVLGASCLYPCQNGGTCTTANGVGQCTCVNGFVGIDCSRRGCASNCNHRGYCDLSSTPSSCLCFPGFGGLECELSVSSTSVTMTTGSTSTTGTATSTSNSTSTPVVVNPLKPIDRTICNPPCHSINGVCWQGSCACAEGFTGKTCSDFLCADDCSFRGKCDKRTGECQCYHPYTGPTCAGQSAPVIPRPVDTMADVDGSHHAIPISQQLGRIFSEKKGLSDVLHLIEESSQQQQQQGTDSDE